MEAVRSVVFEGPCLEVAEGEPCRALGSRTGVWKNMKEPWVQKYQKF